MTFASIEFAAPHTEPFVLPDGRQVAFGPVGRASRDLVVRALARISDESSRLRFFTTRRRFSDREIDVLTELDGVDRYAVGASVWSSGGVEGIGVARYVRTTEPDAAEVALLVVDDYQHRGLGRALFSRLAAWALSRGVTRFRGIVLVDNTKMLALLRSAVPDLALARDADCYSVDVPAAAFVTRSGRRPLPGMRP